MGDIGPERQRFEVLPTREPGRSPRQEPVVELGAGVGVGVEIEVETHPVVQAVR